MKEIDLIKNPESFFLRIEKEEMINSVIDRHKLYHQANALLQFLKDARTPVIIEEVMLFIQSRGCSLKSSRQIIESLTDLGLLKETYVQGKRAYTLGDGCEPRHTTALGARNKSYFEYLKNSVESCQDYEGILAHLPGFYTILCNIARDSKCDWYTKMLINAALSYLVVENDVISEKKQGAKGYLDDLFVCSYALKQIRDNVSKEIIVSNLGDGESKEDILEVIYEVVTKSSSYLGKKTKKILDFVGLSKFNEFDFQYNNEKMCVITRLKRQRRLIYAMLAVKTYHVLHNMISTRHTIQLREHLFEHPEFTEIKKYMELAQENE